ADRPEGPFTDPNKKALISKNASMNTNVPWLFDPAAFVDDDGQAYLYFGGGDGESAGTNLRVIKLGSNMTSTNGNAVTINSPCSFEAAYMHKYNGTYYFSYSTNFATCSPKGGSAYIDYLTSSNPMTGFAYKGTLIANPALNGQNINDYGNNHAHTVFFKDKWYIFYHDRRLKKTNSVSSGEYRSVSVDLFTYKADGTINQTVVTADGPPQIKNLNPYDTILATTIYKQSGAIKTAICSATNPGTVSNSANNTTTNANSAGTAGDRCVMLTSITDGSWVRLKRVDFGTASATKFLVRAASASTGGSIEIRTGSNTGTLAGTCAIGATGGITTWKDIECDIDMSAGVKDSITLVFKGQSNQFRVSKYIFKSSAPSNISVTCDVNNLVSSYDAGSNVPRPNVNCSTGEPGTAKFSIGGTAIDGWDSPGGTHQLYNAGTRTVTLESVKCGGTEITLNPAISCGSFEIVPDETPIAIKAPLTRFSVRALSGGALRIEANAQTVVEIFDLKGNKAASLNVSAGSQTVKLSLPSGVYFAKARGMRNVMFVIR
ncbi:MAG: carbohydrate-binding protein, partial [Fibromonadaceae bacterium]|nr:carbohydrate-binding protein [Fibromonadaceae bacterium]